MSPTQLVQLIVGFVGFALSMVTFWLGSRFAWSSELQVSTAIGIALFTVLIEVVISLVSVKEAMLKFYPTLEFGVREQKDFYEVISALRELHAKEGPAAALAVASFNTASATVRKAATDQDFQVEDMFQANVEALRSLSPGERFLGLSSIKKPDQWFYDHQLRDYRAMNESQAAKGVRITRIFLVDSEAERDALSEVFRDQLRMGIDVRWIDRTVAGKFAVFPDFTVLPEAGFALYVPDEDRLLTCIATTTPTVIGKMESSFGRLYDAASEPTFDPITT